MIKKSLTLILFGTLFLVIGHFFATADKRFIANSDPATLIVLRVEAQAIDHGKTAYRPVYALQTKSKPRPEYGPEYGGGPYSSPMPHKAGDIVSGRYNPKTGEMRSDTMTQQGNRMWFWAQILGALCILQAIALWFGFPSIITVTSSDRRRGWLQG
ncbi:DUF3592 domain-containing protein [Pseudorhodobacter ferrugineus]|uniref:DUF3592 domain-containing protein n=1 Tax=Pseudorhodobacter ferrugineus TaxID=77008 RepID=UPI0003B44594|nr:DUF3592 domain-containing protein [Pseudorhodobacter ferrugineus]